MAQIEKEEGLKQSIFKELSSLKRKKIEKIHKDAITSVNIMYEDGYNLQKIVTTSMDGFIKMTDTRDMQVKKAFFVC